MANKSSFDAYIQRADDYITKQIHKYEKQRQGKGSAPPRANGYRQVPPPSQGSYPASPAPQGGPYPPQPPPNTMLLPPGWSQEFDPSSQKVYYVDRNTGRSQWNPPPSYAPPTRAATFQPDATTMPTPPNHIIRSNTQPVSSPGGHGGQCMDPRQQGGGMGTGTLSPSMHLPPGSHLDLRTGMVVNGMFPEGQTQQSWSQSLQRI
ncbi:WW domain [Pyrenophora seminiperda CCB06]|uniref:WW domain n=1 Tax=Pyrenophora seminiperda CCB06 TaxID=1302712 RepID=A0A3M7LZA1_9PLEO|nr:WW domain [Pyrenophora seminiperda CCB06]